MKISQEAQDLHLKSLRNGLTCFENSLRHAKQSSGQEESHSGFIGNESMQQRMPSAFFEDVLSQLEESVIQLNDKIENSDLWLARVMNSGSGALAARGQCAERCRCGFEVATQLDVKCREMNEAELLLDIIQRNYNMFLTQSAAVGELVKKMDEVKEKFLALRRKEIKTRRKKLTCESVCAS